MSNTEFDQKIIDKAERRPFTTKASHHDRMDLISKKADQQLKSAIDEVLKLDNIPPLVKTALKQYRTVSRLTRGHRLNILTMLRDYISTDSLNG